MSLLGEVYAVTPAAKIGLVVGFLMSCFAAPASAREREAWAQAAVGVASITQSHSLEERTFGRDISWRASVDLRGSGRLSLSLGVTRVAEFVSLNNEREIYFVGSELYEAGPARKSMWLIGPRVCVRVVSLLEDRLQFRTWGGLVYVRTVITLLGDLNLDREVRTDPVIEVSDAVSPLVGGELSIALAPHTQLFLDWELAVASDGSRILSSRADQVSFFHLGLRRRFL